ncbi:amidophosphoribosyltransferase [Ktedonosporobacter rubrisoli]|uniref:Amidophosphoribosyltransferase n=1 Tax=Ktedonosporobacter rubrisoli TaxID=2509675 RepID=A0A4V0YZM5_KTERU|nr:amidophosphoribosyltransferase [Ktedonosporobacter rubrisoli]QBD80241.1 amidophosphoribosyltransferase [Ktedonosporobacter rubrisoli]
MERLHDACGVVGIYAQNNAEELDVRRYLTLALTALQHRGQESAGMAVYDGNGQIAHRVAMGKVRDIFQDSGTSLPPTRCGIGHVRYSTTGSSCVENAGPFVVGGKAGQYEAIAVAHNGDLVNGRTLREGFPQNTLSSTTDSEVMAHLLLHAEGQTLRERMIATFPLLRGSYSLVILAEGKIYAMRDPWGMRPLCIGRIGNNWIVASESCALDRLGAIFVRDVEPGELITIDEQGVHAEMLVKVPRQALCVFEYIYFSDATSQLSKRHVYLVREALGRELAKEHPVEADMVVPVPDSSIPAAAGYAAAAGIPYGHAIIKNRYSDRTFIKPDQRLRQLEVDLKFNLVQPKIEGARLVIVDDSIVRGNTMKRLVSALRHRGVKEIHLRSSSPPLRHPCYFGIDIPREEELVAAGRSIQEVADYIGVDSLGYLSLPGLGRALNSVGRDIPADLDDETAQQMLHNEFCYGCMVQSGWPFDPIEAAGYGAQLIRTVTRNPAVKGQ